MPAGTGRWGICVGVQLVPCEAHRPHALLGMRLLHLGRRSKTLSPPRASSRLVEEHVALLTAVANYDRSFRDAGRADQYRAELVVLRLFQSTAWSEHDERRRVADFEALDHDLRAAIGIAVRDASAQTTADDERDALGLAAETLERLAALV